MLRQQKYLLLVGFLSSIANGVLWAVFAPYIRLLGFSATIYGVLGGLGVVVSAFSTLAAGVLSDQIGARKITSLGYLTASISFMLMYIGSLWSLLAASLINGFAGGLHYTGLTVLTSRSTEDKKLHYAFSYVFAFSTLGGAFGSFMGWIPVIFSDIYGISLLTCYRLFLLTPIPLLLSSSLLVLRTSEEVPKKKYGSIRLLLSEFRHIPRKFLTLVILNSIISFGAALSIHNIDYYFTAKYGITSGELGSIFGLQQLFMALLMLKLPNIADRIGGPLKTYLLVTFPSIPLLIAMTFVNNYLVASTIYIARSILMNIANPLFNAFSMTLIPRELRGKAASLISLPWTLVGGIGRAVGGKLLDIDLELPLRITAILYAVSLTGTAIVFRDYIRKEEIKKKHP